MQSPGGTVYLLDSPQPSATEVIDLTNVDSDDDIPRQQPSTLFPLRSVFNHEIDNAESWGYGLPAG